MFRIIFRKILQNNSKQIHKPLERNQLPLLSAHWCIEREYYEAYDYNILYHWTVVTVARHDTISRRLFWDFCRKCPHELSLSCHHDNDVLVVLLRFVCVWLLLRIVAELYPSARRKVSHWKRVSSVNTDSDSDWSDMYLLPLSVSYIYIYIYVFCNAAVLLSDYKPYPYLLFCLHYFAHHHQSARCSPIKRIANKNYMTSLS